MEFEVFCINNNTWEKNKASSAHSRLRSHMTVKVGGGGNERAEAPATPSTGVTTGQSERARHR